MRIIIAIILLITVHMLSCERGKQNSTGYGIGQDQSTDNLHELKPDTLVPEKTIRLIAGDLEVVFADNSAYGEDHRDGYNGISELRHNLQDSNLFVPFYAGFNLEHIFGGDSLVQLFEPRLHPMELFRISDREVLLYQDPTPLSRVESQTRFRLVEPHYIDISFRFIIHDEGFFRHGYAGLFWASYINRPADRSLYFHGMEKGKDTGGWIRAFSSEHGVNSTHTWIKDTGRIYFAPEFNASLASHFSDYNFDLPFFYGRFHQMVFACFFDPSGGIRFSQSPTGGGEYCPAWDFQYIVQDFKTSHEYSFRARLVYKAWKDQDDILKEYAGWMHGSE
ncbi:MAG: hypothetical protein KFF73_04865 [Cyclobacteriaceae bacterium]|nr:hypothetical protein [Cyclobacteriaceae bacterium]